MLVNIKQLGKLLQSRDLTISIAESCTGGLIQKLITDVPGSSRYFIGGAVVYSNKLKEKFAGVRPKTLLKYGAVSEEVARELAKGIASVTKSDIGISTTGIAGPEGATSDKPVGLVYVAIYFLGKCTVYKYLFKGNRQKIREQTAKKALQKIIEIL